MGDKSKVIERHRAIERDVEAARRAPPAEDAVRCSFCSKGSAEALAMFEGPRAFICDACVLIFAGELAKR